MAFLPILTDNRAFIRSLYKYFAFSNMRYSSLPLFLSILRNPSMLALFIVTTFALGGIKSAMAQGSYVVGPGDSFSLQLFGIPESRQEAVPVGADGTVSFLEARRVRVAGLTIAQARKRVEDALAVSVRSPRLIMNPVALGSKKYTILGMVGGNGTFPLDSEVTLIDAIARSGGIQDAGSRFRAFVFEPGRQKGAGGYEAALRRRRPLAEPPAPRW